MSKIKVALQKRFQEHRVIFWYDEKVEFTEEFSSLHLDSVEKLQVEGNEFEIKYKLFKEQPDSKFLLFFPSAKPANEDNWLLDVELANHVFHTDQEAMVLQDLDLDYHYKELVSEHLEFFKSKERSQKLKELLSRNDEHHAIRCKMLSVVFGTPTHNLLHFVLAYAVAIVDEKRDYKKKLEKFNLSDFFWDEVARIYNYQSETPSIYDLILDVFSQNFSVGENRKLSKESRLILTSWKDTLPYRNFFSEVSEKIAADLGVENSLAAADLDEIINDDLFKVTDKKIIHDLLQVITSEGISVERLTGYIKRRENKFWYEDFRNLYQCLLYGAKLIELSRKYTAVKYSSFTEGTSNYAASLFEVDQVYRKFIWNYRMSNHNNVLSGLAAKVEKVYSNDWLLNYNNSWQAQVEALEQWPTHGIKAQRGFFEHHVKPVVSKNLKLFVVISDALRYECGAELQERIGAEKRFESELDYLVSSLPSYTQLGMASLLPHQNLQIQDNSDWILADGQSATGTAGRTKILQANSGVRATAIKAADFMKMPSKTEGRDFAKQYDLIYIYHNRIDKTGDDSASEEKVFDAVEEELSYLLELLRKIYAMNGNNIYITSDHGFIYQNQKLEESDFSVSQHKGDIWKENRRFVIGKKLIGDSATKSFSASALGLENEDLEILIPKSINRLRIKGAGSRFVHGGATLQEIVVPLLKVARKREDTVSQVEIDIIKSTDKITTNILAVSFIQSDLVADNVLPRMIKTGIYAEDGELLSDQFTFNFDIEEGSERQREVKHQFLLSKKASGAYKNQRVKLILEEPVAGSNKWKTYKEFYYTLNISFASDFD